jgi:hypothetical protein
MTKLHEMQRGDLGPGSTRLVQQLLQLLELTQQTGLRIIMHSLHSITLLQSDLDRDILPTEQYLQMLSRVLLLLLLVMP